MIITFGELVLKWDKADRWVIHAPYHVSLDDVGLIIPTGFKTDLTSIPITLWGVLSPMGAYTPAAILHDYLYWLQACTKERADFIFLEAMRSLGIKEILALALYRGVKNFGHTAWNNHSERIRDSYRQLDLFA